MRKKGFDWSTVFGAVVIKIRFPSVAVISTFAALVTGARNRYGCCYRVGGGVFVALIVPVVVVMMIVVMLIMVMVVCVMILVFVVVVIGIFVMPILPVGGYEVVRVVGVLGG